MATRAQLQASINALPEPQRSAAQAVYDRAATTGTGVSANEITYITNNLNSISSTTDPNNFLGTAAQRITANTSGASVPGYTPTPTPTPTVTTVALTNEDWLSIYSSKAALVDSNPELKALFNQAVAEKWTGAKFQAAFESTSWFKTNGSTWRLAETARLSDPGSWAAALTKLTAQISQTARDMGFELNPADIDKLAKDTLYLSWGQGIDESLLRQHVAATGRITGTGGEAATTMQKLKEQASNMGLQYGDEWYMNAAKGALSGQSNMAYYDQQIINDAKSKYGAFADQIDAGQTMSSIASPYVQSMARILQLSPTDIDLTDPTIAQALMGFDAQNKPVAKPVWAFERELKQDDRYFKTNTAVQDMTGLASEIARQFGKM
jgi:hypothetical protein